MCAAVVWLRLVRLILYDAIGTLAESVGSELRQKEHIQVLMPPLLNRLAKLSDEDRALFPLLECLTSVVQALGMAFAPFAKAVFTRCLQIIERNIIAQQQAVCRPPTLP
jgi:transportin-1